MLSIVVPTINEEDYLPLLLESIKKQDFNDGYEIIVADAGSSDRTVEVAKSFNCQVVLGGSPAIGKNRGAANTNGDLIFFVDADVILPDNFFQDNLREFQERNLDLASFYLQSLNKSHNAVFNLLFNLPSRATEKFLPQAMNSILVKKNIHLAIDGFNEEVKIGEELDYLRRGVKFGKFGVLKSAKILVSSRRFQEDGWLKTWLKYFLCQVYMLFFGPVKSNILRYRFNHYSQKKENKIK